MDVLFDSNVLIDALRGIPAAVAELSQPNRRYVSFVTRIEVLAGYADDLEAGAALDMLSKMGLLGMTLQIQDGAIALRRTTRLKLPDAIILATARVHGLILSTRNTTDFSTADPTVRIPYQL